MAPAPGGTSARLAFIVPLAGSGASPAGALAGWTELSTNPIFQRIVERLEAVEEGEAYLTDGAGRILVHPDTARILQTPSLPRETGRASTVTASDGTRQLVLVQPAEGYPWQVVISIPQRTVNALAVQLATRLMAVLVAVGAVMMIVLYATSRRLTRPLREMAVAAESIARGNLALPIRVRSEDEIGRLAMAFEGMRRSLQARLREMDLLLASSQRLASSFDLGGILPPILEGVGRLLRADHVRVLLLGSEADVAGKTESYFAGKDRGNWSSLDMQVVELARQRGKFLLENPGRARAVLNLAQVTEPLQGLVAQDVDMAIEKKTRRVNLIEEKLQEMIDEGTIMIDSDGMVVGQVNGLSVYSMGDYAFGKPSRITVKTSLGKAGIINIERESEMSGPIHNKGVYILSGYLRDR